MRKYNRKILAYLAVFLMIVFILPTTFRGNAGRAMRGDAVEGHINAFNADLTAGDIQTAREDVEALRSLAMRGPRGMVGPPLIYLLATPREQQMAFYARMGLGPPPQSGVVAELMQHPEMFALLTREAQLSGMSVSPDRVDTVLADEVVMPPNADPQTHELYRRAVNNLLLVQSAYARAAQNIHVTEPMRRLAMASEDQNLTLDVVEFNAKDFLANVPAPTTQQLSYQFDRFAAKTAGASDSKENAFGFGYRYPNRIKLQYITVYRDAVRDSIKPKNLSPDDDYAWQVRARRYYAEHPTLFTTTQPTTAPKSSAFDLSTTAPTTGPSIKPFAEVQQEIIDRLVREETAKKAEAIQNKINSRLAGDWLAYQQAMKTAGSSTTTPSTQPGAAAPTSYGVPFNSYAYLQKLAEDIQKQDGVLPLVTQMADDFLSQQQLTELPGIGKSHFERIPFAEYAIEAPAPFVPPQARSAPLVLNVYQPSRVLRDDQDNTYVFRIVGTDSSHPPLDRSEVADKVTADCKNAAAFEQAKAAAQTLLDDAKKSTGANLRSTAEAAKKTIITAGPIRGSETEEIPGIKISDEDSRKAFVAAAVDLLRRASSESPHPMGLIELPREGKVLFAQLTKVEPTWQRDSQFADQLRATAQLRSTLEQGLAMDWYRFDNIVARLRYVPKERSDNQTPTTPAPNNPSPPEQRL